jgi:hypothetical protein
MRHGLLGVGVAMVLLAGCAPEYVAPSSGATATMTFANETLFPVRVMSFAVAKECRNAARLPGIAAGGKGEARIPAGREWAFSMEASDDKTACALAGSFRAEEGASYRATLRSDSVRCILSLVSLPDGGRVPFQAKIFSEANLSTWCSER